ncbi:MAG: SRPBCC family protein [Acidimicrobiia bacterium]
MTDYPEQGSASVHVDAPPEVVWALIADVTRMGEWSPECVKAEWVDGATGPAVDAPFRGYNQAGTFEWDLPCVVTACAPGRVFEFDAPSEGSVRTRWRFEVAPDGAGTQLTESFDAPMINVDGAAANFDGRYEMLVEAIGRTIANIKAAAEA